MPPLENLRADVRSLRVCNNAEAPMAAEGLVTGTPRRELAGGALNTPAFRGGAFHAFRTIFSRLPSARRVRLTRGLNRIH